MQWSSRNALKLEPLLERGDLVFRAGRNAGVRRVDRSDRDGTFEQRLDQGHGRHRRQHRPGRQCRHQAATGRDRAERILQREHLGKAGGDKFADAVAERRHRAKPEMHPQFRRRIGHDEDGRLCVLRVAQQLLGLLLARWLGEHQRANVDAAEMRLQNRGAGIDLAPEHRLLIVKLAAHIDVLRALSGKQKRDRLSRQVAHAAGECRRVFQTPAPRLHPPGWYRRRRTRAY